MANALALFDFDGTLTAKDSLGDFILFAFGKPKTVIGGVLLSPTLAGYALGLMDNSKAKQQVLKYFFGGMSVEKMNELGQRYAKERLPKILRLAGLEKLKWHQQQGHQIVIVSASTKYWLKPWVDSMGFDLLATQLEVKEHKLTGCYAGENCHGEEKVRRIQAAYDLTQYDEIYAYGDTSGDKPM
ncbi:MAG: HAD family hydrolase, partial [Gammaproteobacteria bacterium]|nr:HAD family hydrolase [Gammaproteobacteria bacterium]